MDSTDDISQQLDDMLLDDLVDANKESNADTGTLTPGQFAYEERRSKIVDSELARLTEELGIEESTRMTAKSLFDQFANETGIDGLALEVLAAACLYTACKVEKIPLSPDDFTAVPQTGFTRVILLRRVKKISHTLGLDPSAFFDPHGYIDRYCDELGLNEEIKKNAHEVIGIADNAGIGGGKSPTGRAAAAIYNSVLDHGRNATQKDIAKVADVTEVTIRNRYQEQRDLLTEDSSHKPSNDSEFGTATPEQKPGADDTSKPTLPDKSPVAGQTELSRSDIATLLRYTAIKAKRAPRVSDINTYTGFSLKDVKNHFDSLAEARGASGVSKDDLSNEPLWTSDEPQTEVTPDELGQKIDENASITHRYSDATVSNPDKNTLLDEMNRLAEDKSRPTRTDIESRSPFSIEDYEETFGFWTDALEEAGYSVGGRSETITRSDVISCLQDVARQIDDRPKITDVNHYGSISGQSAYKYFDSWEEALKAANVAEGPPD
jgi:hypothetical protein